MKGFLVFAILLIPIVCAETLEVTEEHPFLLNGDWVEARELETGDLLTTVDGELVRITKITRVEEPVTVYNLEAGVFHDFVVGVFNLVVHNSEVPTTADEVLEQATKGADEAAGVKTLAEMEEEVAREIMLSRNLEGTPPVIRFDDLTETELKILSGKAANVEHNGIPLVAVYSSDSLPTDYYGFAYIGMGEDNIPMSINSITKEAEYYMVMPLDDMGFDEIKSITSREIIYGDGFILPDSTRVFSSADEVEKYVESITGSYGWEDTADIAELSAKELKEQRRIRTADIKGWAVWSTSLDDIERGLDIDIRALSRTADSSPQDTFNVMDLGAGKGEALKDLKGEFGDNVKTYGAVFSETPGEVYEGVDVLLVGDAKTAVPDAQMDVIISHYGAMVNDPGRAALLDEAITWLKPNGRASLHYCDVEVVERISELEAVLKRRGITDYQFITSSEGRYVLQFTKPG